jgi:thymidylate synthase
VSIEFFQWASNYRTGMETYHHLVETVLREGNYKKNRTNVDTIADFSHHYQIDLAEGYPLLTSKKMDTFRWDSMLHELVWYLSGEHHIRELREKTAIWDSWADKEGNLPSAYGRFWRRFPVPESEAQLPGEAWASEQSPWVQRDDETDTLVFDQLGYVVDTLKGENPNRNRHSRRLVVLAWHPANAGGSALPPCHYTFVINVQAGRLNCHLTQRSADIALGVPFNIAAYALLARILGEVTEIPLGKFSHTLVDAHIYCGREERGEWYAENLSELQERLASVDNKGEYQDIRNWVLENAPPEPTTGLDVDNHKYGYDHVPGLLEQLARAPLGRPKIELDIGSLNEFSSEGVTLRDYESHGDLRFEVAE